jgi:hypothetical protein
MYYAFALFAAVLVLALIILYVVRQQTGFLHRHAEVDRELHDPRTPTLEYDIPTGQDPTVIRAALEREGYITTVDTEHAHQRVLIACPSGVDRERGHVRAVIQSASVSTQDDGVPLQLDVRFRDE